MLAAKSASPLICGLSKPVSRSSRSCSITAAMWAMPPVVERMKPSDPVEVEGIHNVSVTLLQILLGGEEGVPPILEHPGPETARVVKFLYPEVLGGGGQGNRISKSTLSEELLKESVIPSSTFELEAAGAFIFVGLNRVQDH